MPRTDATICDIEATFGCKHFENVALRLHFCSSKAPSHGSHLHCNQFAISKNCGFPRLHSNYKAIKLSLAWNSKNCSQCGHHSSSRSSKTRCRALHNQILSDDQTSSRYGPTNQNRVRVQIFTCKRESANRLNCFRITRLSLGQMCPLEKREGKWPAAHFGQDSSKYRSSRLGFSYFQPSIPKVV